MSWQPLDGLEILPLSVGTIYIVEKHILIFLMFNLPILTFPNLGKMANGASLETCFGAGGSYPCWIVIGVALVLGAAVSFPHSLASDVV